MRNDPPRTCGVWHVDHITSTTIAERFITCHAFNRKLQSGNWRCWLRRLPAGDDRAGQHPNGIRFYGDTQPLAVWEAANWLYRSWVTPATSERRMEQRLV